MTMFCICLGLAWAALLALVHEAAWALFGPAAPPDEGVDAGPARPLGR